MRKRGLFLIAITLLLGGLMIVTFRSTASKAEDSEDVFEPKTGNLLINGDAEDGMTGWTDPDDAWDAIHYYTAHSGAEHFWPSREDLPITSIYQDVDLSEFKAGDRLELSGWLCNFQQAPHDMSTLQLEIMNVKGDVLKADESSQRNPEWEEHIIVMEIPKNAVTARVTLKATRFVGTDNDGYFDDIALICDEEKFNTVYIIGSKSTAEEGETIKLTANNGVTTKASKFTWSSSYNEHATVDENGVVTILFKDEVIIYAKDNASGVTGKYYINSESGVNVSPKPSRVTGLKSSAANKTSITLKWTKSKNATGYYIYQYNTDTKKYVKIKTIKKASTVKAEITGLAKDTSYKFKVTAYRSYGKKIYKATASKVLTASTTK